MSGRWTVFNRMSVAAGLLFLYLPILLLIVYSFNASKLVTVWAGFRQSGMWRRSPIRG